MDLRSRVRERIAAWQIVVESVTETESSVLAFGRRHDQPVVLKVVRNPADEWRSGATLEAVEREMITGALARAGNNKSAAARLLGVSRAQLYSRLEKHGLA